MKNFLALMLITLFGHCAFAANTTIEVIPLSHRPASELLPLLMPLFGDSAQLIDNGSNLLVKTRPERLAEIKAIIRQLDVRQSNLLITVVQSQQATADKLNAIASTGMRGYVYQTQDKQADENTQTIRTLEGVPAYIKAGNIYAQQNFSGYGYPVVTEQTEATTGFSVTPQLVGQQVMLSVSPWSDKMNRQGHIETQNAQSTLRINLGEWVELGGTGEIRSDSTRVNRRQTADKRTRILIKVDRVD
ncbi:MAG: secretin N-terminal domain-containing protein [Methylobacter sp.]